MADTVKKRHCRCKNPKPTATVRVSLAVPLGQESRITKSLIRRKDVVIEAVNRDRMTIQCQVCKKVWW